MRALCGTAVLGLALLLAGCGGGDGGDGRTPPPPSALSLFDGDYFFQMIGGDSDPTNTGIAGWGTATADGAGTYSWDLAANEDGVVSGPATTTPQIYTVGSDRSVTWEQAGVTTWRGGISARGDLLGLGMSGAGLPCRAALFPRKGSGLDAMDLNGQYHFTGYGFVSIGSLNQSTWGTASFDGVSGTGLSWSANEEGTITGLGLETLSYTVAPDGELQLTVSGTTEYEGGVLAGGDLAVVSGGTTAADEPFLVVFLPESTSATNASFNGSYFVVGLEHDQSTQTPVNRSYSGTLQADGAGGLAPNLRQNEEGTQTGVSPLWTGYTVAADGTLTVTTPAGETWEGAVSPDGRFAMLAGGTTAGNDPIFFFFFK